MGGDYPWTPVLILVLVLLALSIVRVSRRPKRMDGSLAVHNEFHTGPSGVRYPEFCEHCRDELSG